MRVAIIAALAVLMAASLASAEVVRSGYGVRNIEHGTEYLPGGSAVPEITRANTLLNPGFETGALPPWVSQETYWTVTGADFHTGSFSAEDIGNYSIRQDICPVDVMLVNSVGLWSKQPEGVAYHAVDLFYGDADFDEFFLAPGVDWTFSDLTGDLRTTGTLIAIRIWGYVESGDTEDDLTLIDDIVIDTPGGPSAVEVNTWGKIKALYN